MKETVELLGRVITEDCKRDAIHIAVAPVIAVGRLLPGQHVGFIDADKSEVGTVADSLFVGIVDPFIKTVVGDGERFFLYLYPGSITSLRHEWTHPAFNANASPAAVSVAASEQWLRNFAANQIGIGYQQMMDAAQEWIDGEEYLVQQGSSSWSDNFTNPKEFWGHYEIVTGTKVDDHEAHFFSCSC